MAKHSKKTSRKEKHRKYPTIREIGHLEQSTNITINLGDVEKIATHDARADIDSMELLELFLMSWWSKQYNRPLKDPLLLTYSTEELLYEFYNHAARVKAAKEASEQEDDRMEQSHDKAALDWAEQEELKELGKLNGAESTKSNPKSHQPTQSDIEWMNKKMQEAKETQGETFGEDISEDFEQQ